MTLALTLLALFTVAMWSYAIYIALYMARKRGELTGTWIAIGAVPIVIGFVIDVIVFNWIVATVVLREWPRESTFSARLNRWYRSYAALEREAGDYRLEFVMWWAAQLNALTPDSIEHIHKHDRPKPVK